MLRATSWSSCSWEAVWPAAGDSAWSSADPSWSRAELRGSQTPQLRSGSWSCSYKIKMELTLTEASYEGSMCILRGTKIPLLNEFDKHRNFVHFHKWWHIWRRLILFVHWLSKACLFKFLWEAEIKIFKHGIWFCRHRALLCNLKYNFFNVFPKSQHELSLNCNNNQEYVDHDI